MIFSEFCSLVRNLNTRLWITTWEVLILVKEILEDLFSSSSVSIKTFNPESEFWKIAKSDK